MDIDNKYRSDVEILLLEYQDLFANKDSDFGPFKLKSIQRIIPNQNRGKSSCRKDNIHSLQTEHL